MRRTERAKGIYKMVEACSWLVDLQLVAFKILEMCVPAPLLLTYTSLELHTSSDQVLIRGLDIFDLEGDYERVLPRDRSAHIVRVA
jgi:hypothetical protein